MRDFDGIAIGDTDDGAVEGFGETRGDRKGTSEDEVAQSESNQGGVGWIVVRHGCS